MYLEDGVLGRQWMDRTERDLDVLGLFVGLETGSAHVAAEFGVYLSSSGYLQVDRGTLPWCP